MADLFAISNVQGKAAQHVIFFHGLAGHPHNTWRLGTEPEGYWLQWLAEDIQGLAVWAVGYDAAVSHWRGSAMHLTDRATNVLERILAEPRFQTGEIILIGHSLGGLVIKQLLRTAGSMALHREDIAHFIKRVRRVAFLATPHLGADLAMWGNRLRIIILPSAATVCLIRNAPSLRDLNLWYRDWSTAHSIAHLILTESQSLRWWFGLVVKPDSSDPGLSSRPIPIDANHSTICKPKDRSSEIYLHIRNFITRPLDTAHRETVIEHTLKEQSTQLKMLMVSTQEGNAQLGNMIVDQGEKTAELVAGRLQKEISQITSASLKYPKELVDSEIQKQLSIMRRARFFRGISAPGYALRLGERILNGDFAGGSADVRSSALAWCARCLAHGEHGAQANEFLSRAKQLGNGPEVTVAEAFKISADGNFGEALKELVAIESSLARSAAFFIVTRHNDSASTIEWLVKSGITHTDLDADGKFFLITKLFELSHWDTALEYTNALQEEDYQCTPTLFHAAAMAHLVQAVPDELKSFVLEGVPFEVRTFPLASTEASLRSRRKARYLFHQCALTAQELGCVEVASLTEDYALWLELRDPEGQTSGRQKLEASMREPSDALRRLHLALQFSLKLDLEAVEQEIERQTTISGGKSPVVAMARFALAFTKGSPKDIAAYIDRHRAQLQEHLEKKSISAFEIEMLARAGLPQQAEERLVDLIANGLSEAEQNHLRRIIAEAAGVDPLEARKAQFESSGQLNDLVNLVNLLEEQNDWSQLCHYGSLLFDRTEALPDAERLARALHEANRYSDLAALLRRYSEFLNQSDSLQMLWSWSLYREGSLAESATTLEKLREKRDHPNDRDLTVNLAITSGAWETLLPFVEREWANREQREANDLIRIAQLAQVVESPHAKNLVYTAASKSADGAGILAAAYFLAARAGWENEERVTQWLHTAAELSDGTGPLQRKSLKDLVDQAPEWHRREADTWRQVNNGTFPLFGAARLLNRSLIDLFLLPALANPSELDSRRRALVPAYSGTRQPLPCRYRVVAMDATTLLTLGALGLLETASNMFEQVVIPHSTLGWLFEEKQKASFHQPSRMKDASELRHLLAINALKTFRASTVPDADLASEVGEELASLITEAWAKDSGQEQQKIVVRSFPVHRISSLMEEEADLSPYYSYFCSCLAVVKN